MQNLEKSPWGMLHMRACVIFFFCYYYSNVNVFPGKRNNKKGKNKEKEVDRRKKKIGIPSGRRARKFVSYGGVTMVNFQYNYA